MAERFVQGFGELSPRHHALDDALVQIGPQLRGVAVWMTGVVLGDARRADLLLTAVRAAFFLVGGTDKLDPCGILPGRLQSVVPKWPKLVHVLESKALLAEDRMLWAARTEKVGFRMTILTHLLIQMSGILHSKDPHINRINQL